MNKSKHYTLTLRLAEQSGNRFQGAMELVTSSWAHCCSPRMVVVVVVVVVVTMHSALSSPHLAAVGAAAGGVLAVDGPLVTALQPVVDNLRKSEKLSSALRIRGGPVAAPESRIQLNPEHSN